MLTNPIGDDFVPYRRAKDAAINDHELFLRRPTALRKVWIKTRWGKPRRDRVEADIRVEFEPHPVRFFLKLQETQPNVFVGRSEEYFFVCMHTKNVGWVAQIRGPQGRRAVKGQDRSTALNKLFLLDLFQANDGRYLSAYQVYEGVVWEFRRLNGEIQRSAPKGHRRTNKFCPPTGCRAVV